MLTRWSPFEELTTLHREMDRLFSRAFDPATPQAPGHTAFVPAIEVVSEKDGWNVRLALPGVEPKDVQIEVAGNTLTVRGERPARDARKEAYLSEISYGRFERTLTLPESIDPDSIAAELTNGVLHVTVSKKPEAQPKRIEIK